MGAMFSIKVLNICSYKKFPIFYTVVYSVFHRCSQKQSCGIGVSSTIFGDPCPGTLKYLEVQYQCVSRKCNCPFTFQLLKTNLFYQINLFL